MQNEVQCTGVMITKRATLQFRESLGSSSLPLDWPVISHT